MFIISGYLFALHDEQPHRQRVRKRARTLLAPYLIWSAFGILLTFLLELHPSTRSGIASSHVVQIDDTRMLIHDYRWYEVVIRWIFFPVSYQLWFIRVLFVYNLAYPLIVKAVTHKPARYVFFAIAVLSWLGTVGLVFVEGEGLLFFALCESTGQYPSSRPETMILGFSQFSETRHGRRIWEREGAWADNGH